MKFGKMMYYDKRQVLFKDGVDRKRYAGHWSKKTFGDPGVRAIIYREIEITMTMDIYI